MDPWLTETLGQYPDLESLVAALEDSELRSKDFTAGFAIPGGDDAALHGSTGAMAENTEIGTGVVGHHDQVWGPSVCPDLGDSDGPQTW